MWNGSYQCDKSAPATMIQLELVNRRSLSTLEGLLKILGEQLIVRGSFASYFKSITLVSDPKDFILNGSKTIDAVELDGDLSSPLTLEGVAIFSSTQGREICNLTMERYDGKCQF